MNVRHSSKEIFIIGADFNKYREFLRKCGSVLHFASIANIRKLKLDDVSYTFRRVYKKIAETVASCFHEADAFIYMPNVSDEDMIFFEKYRNRDKCIALHFESLDLSPKECMKKIEGLQQGIEDDYSYKKKISSVMLSNLQDEKSAFADLPTEIAIKICGHYHLASNRNIFFSLPKEIKNKKDEQVQDKLLRIKLS